MATTLKTLGNVVRTFDQHDTFPTPAGVDRVVLTRDDGTALCPVTGQPDWYTVRLAYVPDAHCLESKSLKLFLQTFRAAGMFGEALASHLAAVLGAVLTPHRLSVRVSQKSRGGITILSRACW